MAIVYVDRVQETTPTTGTGTLTLSGASAGYQGFSAIGVGNETYYVVLDTVTNAWEVGIGTYSVGALSRDTVLASSNANALVNFGAGSKTVFATASAQFYANALSTVGHATINHSGIPGVPAPEAFTALVHGTTDHTGITGVPAPEAFTAPVHAATNHAGIPGVGDLSTAAHALIDHSAIPGVLSSAAHLLVDHNGVPGVASLRNASLNLSIDGSPTTIYTIPAGTLANNGDTLEFEVWFDGLSAGGVSYTTFSLGGTNLLGGPTNAPENVTDRHAWLVRVVRTGAATGTYTARVTVMGAVSASPAFGALTLTWANTQAIAATMSSPFRCKASYIRVSKQNTV
jgi:hypothetical protein